jgi:hypothetical protein
MYLSFTDYNITGFTGDQSVDLIYTHSDVYNPTVGQLGAANFGHPTGYILFNGGLYTGGFAGDYILSYDTQTYAEYSATQPSGLGIEGYVFKHAPGEVTLYNSRAYVFNGISGEIITSEYELSTAFLYFNILSQPIKIGIQDGGLNWYNSSVIFSETPTFTPTVTPTPAPTIATGYVRTTVAAWDLNGNMISGVNINIYDIEASVWKNSTEDADGIEYIDTLPYHTLNIYGSYTVHPNVYTDAELLGVETGYYGNYYYLTLFPYTPNPPGEGNTNLYIQVLENINKLPVPGVFLQVAFAGNATIGVYTNSAGVQVVTVPNNTVMSITATKAGWLGNVVTIDSGPGPTSVVGIGIDRAYVTTTPTITAGPGGVIPTTFLPGIGPTSSAGQIAKAQDNEMMNKIRMAGPDLIDLAIAATIFGLIGLMLTGIKRI